MPFQTPFEGKKRLLNGVFLSVSPTQGIDKKKPFIVSNGPIYRLFYWPVNSCFKQNVFKG